MKTDPEYITQHPDSEPLRRLRASIIGQLALKDKLPLIVEAEGK